MSKKKRIKKIITYDTQRMWRLLKKAKRTQKKLLKRKSKKLKNMTLLTRKEKKNQ